MLQQVQVFLRQSSRVLGCAILTMAIVGTPAHAQIGGLVKKARDAATRKATDETGVNAQLEGEDVTYTEVILELTPQRVDKVIAGLQASRAKLSGRPALVDRRDAAATRAADLNDRNRKALDATSEKRQQVASCRSEEFTKREDARGESLSGRVMSDPALLKQFQDVSARMAQAQMQGDTAAIRKIGAELQQFTAPTAADSAAVDKACGVPVPLSAVEQEIQSLQAQVSQLDEQLRSMEAEAAQAGGSASGMNERQFAMARERMEMWLSRLKSNSKQHGLSTNELKALTDRRADIEKAM